MENLEVSGKLVTHYFPPSGPQGKIPGKKLSNFC